MFIGNQYGPGTQRQCLDEFKCNDNATSFLTGCRYSFSSRIHPSQHVSISCFNGMMLIVSVTTYRHKPQRQNPCNKIFYPTKFPPTKSPLRQKLHRTKSGLLSGKVRIHCGQNEYNTAQISSVRDGHRFTVSFRTFRQE